MDAARVELLQRMPVFGGLREAALARLLVRAARVQRAGGEPFFVEGDAAEAMYVLEQGRVAVSKRWQGTDYLLRELGAGDCFGEMALMDLQPRRASVHALEDCTAIEFGTHDMLHLYETDAEQFALMQMNLGRELCRRLRATDERLFRAAMGELPSRPVRLARLHRP
jgi:CRP/FNR family transcriptional regulator, cyclic AMP receptor protein